MQFAVCYCVYGMYVWYGMCVLKEQVLLSWFEAFLQRLWKSLMGFFLPVVRSGLGNVKVEMKHLCSVLLHHLWSPAGSAKPSRLKWHRHLPSLSAGASVHQRENSIGQHLEVTQKYLPGLNF